MEQQTVAEGSSARFCRNCHSSQPFGQDFHWFNNPQPGAKQQTLNCLKEFNWATRKKMAKLCKRGFTEEYINVHKLFLNDDGSFKSIACWYVPDNYHVSNYGVYFTCKQFLDTSGLISKVQ